MFEGGLMFDKLSDEDKKKFEFFLQIFGTAFIKVNRLMDGKTEVSVVNPIDVTLHRYAPTVTGEPDRRLPCGCHCSGGCGGDPYGPCAKTCLNHIPF